MIRKMKTRSEHEERFALHATASRIAPVREYQFHPTRKWKFDFAFPDQKLAVEIEGGIWTNGRHTRGSGYRGDMEKYNAAALLGWKVLRFDGEAVRSGTAINTVLQALKGE